MSKVTARDLFKAKNVSGETREICKVCNFLELDTVFTCKKNSKTTGYLTNHLRSHEDVEKSREFPLFAAWLGTANKGAKKRKLADDDDVGPSAAGSSVSAFSSTTTTPTPVRGSMPLPRGGQTRLSFKPFRLSANGVNENGFKTALVFNEVVTDLQPVTCFQREGKMDTLRLINALDSAPSPKFVATTLKHFFDGTLDVLKAHLGSLDLRSSSIAFDGWSNANNDKFVNVTLTFIQQLSFRTMSIGIFPVHGSQAAATCLEQVLDQLKLFNMTPEHIRAIATDNCATMEAMWRLASEQYGILHVGCFCHILNNVIENAFDAMFGPCPILEQRNEYCVVLNGKEVSPWSVLATVIGKVHKSGSLKEGLKGRMVAQSKATRGHSKSPLKNKWITPTTLVRFNATRWSSKVSCLSRCIEFQEAIVTTLLESNNPKAVALAEPFKQSIRILEPLYRDLHQLNMLMVESQGLGAIAAQQLVLTARIWLFVHTCPLRPSPVVASFRRALLRSLRDWMGLTSDQDFISVNRDGVPVFFSDAVLVGVLLDPRWSSLSFLEGPILQYLKGGKATVSLLRDAMKKRACALFLKFLRRAAKQPPATVAARQDDDAGPSSAATHSSTTTTTTTTTKTTTTTTATAVSQAIAGDMPSEGDLSSHLQHGLGADTSLGEEQTSVSFNLQYATIEINKYLAALAAMRKDPSLVEYYGGANRGVTGSDARFVLLSHLKLKDQLSAEMEKFVSSFLSVPLGSVAPEFEFSIAGILYSARRRSLNPETAARILFLHSNRELVKAKFFPMLAQGNVSAQKTKSPRVSPALNPDNLSKLRALTAQYLSRSSPSSSSDDSDVEMNDVAGPSTSSGGRGGADVESISAKRTTTATSPLGEEVDEDAPGAQEDEAVVQQLNLALEMEMMRGDTSRLNKGKGPRLLDDFV